jgi:hypothetical protein
MEGGNKKMKQTTDNSSVVVGIVSHILPITQLPTATAINVNTIIHSVIHSVTPVLLALSRIKQNSGREGRSKWEQVVGGGVGEWITLTSITTVWELVLLVTPKLSGKS